MAKKNSKKTVPELRFRGFTDPWEQRQLGEVVVRRSAQAISTEDMPSVEYEDVEAGRGALATSFTFKEGKSGIRFEPGDVLYGKLRPYLGNRLEPDFRGVAVGDWWVLAPLSVTSSFLFSLIQSPRFVTVANQSSGSKMPRADWKLVGSAAFGIPSLPEQHCIGEFFSTLDSLIAAAERQEVLLRQKKQVYLQLMFPREGETQPRLRFAGFSGEWQQRQLGELGSAISGVGFPDAEQGGAGGLPFYKVSDMNLSGNELVMSASSNYVSAEQVMKNHWKPITTIPAIIFAKVGAAVFLDRKRVAATPFLMDNNMMAYIPNGKSWDVDFCLSVFNRIRLSNLARIGALPSINASDVEQHHIALPGLPEQHHIGSFFSTLDNLIAASEKRTASFRALKSAYLQRMFV